MDILFRLKHSERANVTLLNALGQHNANLFDDQPGLPLLYDSGVVYRREAVETWCDVIYTYRQGWEDCDGLSAIRMGELLSRGIKALAPSDPGYDEAKRLRLTTIRAEVFLETDAAVDGPGTYHCVTRYKVGPNWYIDDPSLRLGMREQLVDSRVLERWKRRGVKPGRPLEVS